ncbi:MAG: thiamine pyrophosphate-dependent dehydrogenase E1 component subunit alpha [Gemmatimonadaceae bacterium]|nr:thiamine pyrophosphate-dependent dehydrogenase E1 component subunit alpha [Gemmatimonadaceae bacterium]
MNERFYRALYRIRRVEEEVAKAYPSDKIKSPVHLSIGQEAVAVGVCEALKPEDIVFASYRGHAAYLAKGGDLNRMIAELYGRVTGCAKGKGGSMHLIDVAHGVMGSSAVVGTTIPNAAGYAYALKLRGSDALVAAFFGDGATDEGVFYESLNFAALKRLPMIFICENNSYAIHTHQNQRQAISNIAERAASFGIPAEVIADDVIAVYSAIDKAAKAIRSGAGGPFFFECMTYRWKEHVGPGEDYHLGYRSREEATKWIDNDQVRVAGERLRAPRRASIEAEVEAEIADAFAFAENSPFPSADELWKDVYGASTA